jgi:hypothetical protein
MAKLVVVAVHGISDHILKPGYASQFFALLVDKLKDLGVIPPDADEDQIAQIIECKEVNYSKYGLDAEGLIQTTYVQASGQLYKPWDRLFNWVTLLDKVRHMLITAASDVFVYKDPVCREEIRDAFTTVIKPYVATGDAVSVVGHSLGSVVAFDSIYYNVWHDWKKAGFLPTNLFTMGSPILLFSLDLDNCRTQAQKVRYDPKSRGDEKLIRPDGVWYNFQDPQDVIAYPLQLYFKKKYPVQDIVVGTGVDPLTAHSGYWVCHEMVNTIAARLKGDYDRIKGH